MRPTAVAAAVTLLIAFAVGASLSLASGGGHPLSEASSAAAAPLPTATYVSELGPASVRPPQQSITLPASGSGGGAAGIAWSKCAGLALFVAGALLIQSAFSLRQRRAS